MILVDDLPGNRDKRTSMKYHFSVLLMALVLLGIVQPLQAQEGRQDSAEHSEDEDRSARGHGASRR